METTPDLQAMALFARVLQHNSFSEAARRTGVPVSTLSRRISALEASLGVRLLERTTRAVQPTEAGRDFLPWCLQILEAMTGGQAALERRQAELTGTLRLAAPPSLADFLVVPLVDGFLRQHPRASVRLLVTDRHLDLVEDEVDISLRVGRQTDSSLVQRKLMRYRHVLVASPGYLAGGKRLKRPGDLAHHRLIAFSRWFDDPVWKLSKGSESESIRVKAAFAMNDYAGVIRAARDGMGIAEVPSILCRRELAEGTLQTPLRGWQFEEVDLAAYHLTRRNSSRIVELFLDHCSSSASTIALRKLNPPP